MGWVREKKRTGCLWVFLFQAEDGIRDYDVTGVQTCALPIYLTPVLELARDAEVGRLILLHIDPECPGDDPIGLNGAQNIFPGTVVAEDGDLFEF